MRTRSGIEQQFLTRWIQYDSETSFLIRELSIPDLKAITGVTTRNGFRPNRNTDDQTDLKILRAAILDWKGLMDAKGNEIPFSPEAIEREGLHERLGFGAWIIAECGNDAAFEKTLEAPRKNLQRSPSGTTAPGDGPTAG